MKKTIGNYTPDAGKVMKQSERVICCTGDDGMIYVTNGYLAYKFTPTSTPPPSSPPSAVRPATGP